MSDSEETDESLSDSVVDESALEFTAYEHGDRTFRRKQLGRDAGGEDVGTSLYELDPGKRTWPAHFHTGNEEAIYVLDGALRLWLGTSAERTEHDLSTGSYVALPADEEHAHEVEAMGDEPARFLVVSTMNEPDVTVYPEKNAVGLYAGSPPGGSSDERSLSTHLALEAEVEYWKAD